MSLRILARLVAVPCRLYQHQHQHYHRVPPRNWHLAGHVPPTSLFADAPTDLTEGVPPPPPPATAPAPTPDEWRRHRASIKHAFPGGWCPTRRLSRAAMDGLRSLHALDSATFSCAVLADKFKISPEAVRRILRSKWEPSREKRARLAERERRGREEWIAGRRREEKDRAAQILSEASSNDTPRPHQRRARVRPDDHFFFD